MNDTLVSVQRGSILIFTLVAFKGIKSSRSLIAIGLPGWVAAVVPTPPPCFVRSNPLLLPEFPIDV